MNIAILGATSFLAQRCSTELLRKGHLLTLYSRSKNDGLRLRGNVEWRELDLRSLDSDSLHELESFDVIINCLGAGIQSNHTDTLDEIWLVNAFSPIRLIEHLAEKKYAGLLFTFGSYFEIGESQERPLFSEDEFVAHRTSLPNAYCRSKKVLTEYVASRHISGISFKHLHCVLTNIYGVGENQNRLIPYIFKQTIDGMPLHFSSGNQLRQYTHVDDIAEWLGGVISDERISTGILNLTDETIYSVKQVIEKALSRLNKEGYNISNVTFGDATKRDSSMSFLGLSSSKAMSDFGWNPKKILDMGIDEYHEQYQ